MYCSQKDELFIPLRSFYAGVAELVDALDLGSSAARRGGSTPSTRTPFSREIHAIRF